MGHVQLTEELLYEYMPVIDATIIRTLESEVDYTYKFSTKFKRKMQILIWKESHMWLKDFYHFAKWVAILLLCVLVSLFVLTMSVEAYREKFFQTIKEIRDDFIIFQYYKYGNEQGFTERIPHYLPEGYEEISRVDSDGILSIKYENKTGDQILWDCLAVVDEDYVILDSEYEEEIVKNINGENLSIYVHSGKFLTAYYEYDEYIYIVNTSNLDVNEICRMIQSIVEFD